MNNNPIGIIDSGIGGISILGSLVNNLPNESFLYCADSKNCPFGDKTEAEIYKLTRKMVNFLVSKNIKLLVVACNTITVTCIEKLRKDYPKLPIVGIVPVVKTAAAASKKGKIGIFSTIVTSESQYQKDLINKFAKNKKVTNIGSSDLVAMIEKLDFEGIDRVLDSELAPFKSSDIDVLALGCSHFPLIKERIAVHLPNVLILDSSLAVSHQVKRILENNNLLSTANHSSYNFYNSGNLKPMEYFINELTKKTGLEKIQP